MPVDGSRKMLTFEQRRAFNRFAIKLAPVHSDLALELLGLIEEAGAPKPREVETVFVKGLDDPITSKKFWETKQFAGDPRYTQMVQALRRQGIKNSEDAAQYKWRDTLHWNGVGRVIRERIREVCDAE